MGRRVSLCKGKAVAVERHLQNEMRTMNVLKAQGFSIQGFGIHGFRIQGFNIQGFGIRLQSFGPNRP